MNSDSSDLMRTANFRFRPLQIFFLRCCGSLPFREQDPKTADESAGGIGGPVNVTI